MVRLNNRLHMRLEQLEARMAPAECPAFVFVSRPLPPASEAPLAPGERIVLDYFRQRGLLIEASQRVTCDPRDHGRRCEPEGYLDDVLRDIHQECWSREHGGSCKLCMGTPIADT